MKIKTFLLLAVLTFACALHSRAEVSFDFFFDALSPHGEWIEVGDYGTCWRPNGVDADWRPYADGYWSYTDGGWTWVSYEEYGGIVYHYGRWVEVDDEGWCWVPDYEWAPAWVSWRSNDDYVGWAPLPPEARWRRDTGFSVWVDSHYDIGPARFNFCHVRDFGAPYLRPVIVNRYENVTIIQRTVNVTNISYYNDGGYGGLVHCGGPSFAFINRHVHRPIPALKLVYNTNVKNINVRQVNVFNPVARGNQLAVLAPRVAPPSKDFVKPKPVRSIPAAKVSKGWAGVKDPDVAEGIRTKMRQESRGLTPESAPARRVQASELKMLPKKADPNAPSTVRTAKERSAGDKKPAAVVTEKPAAEKPVEAKPLDPRTAERMLRDKAREPSGEKSAQKPAATVVEPRQPGSVPKPAVTRVPAPEDQPKAKSEKGRQATRSIPPAVAPQPSVEKKKETPDNGGRAPVVKQRTGTDEAAKARAAAAARERSASEQKERAATLERLRATEDSARKQKAQSEAAREMQRRQQVIEQPRRAPAPEIKRSKPADDSAQKAAAQAAARQRQVESARQQQAESARRVQMESARKQQAAASARQQVQQRQAPPPSAQRSAPSGSGGKGKLSKEELEALKKERGR